MRAKIVRLVMAGAIIAAGTVGPVRAAPMAGPTGIVGTGTVIVPCTQYPNYGILAPVYNQVHPTCPDGTKPVVLTVAAAEPRNSYASLCDPGRSYCVHGLANRLWSVEPTQLYCSVVAGRTWYGLMGAGADGHPSQWWTFKVIDGGPDATDRFGAELTYRTDNGPCGARGVKTTPLVAGDFQLVTTP